LITVPLLTGSHTKVFIMKKNGRLTYSLWLLALLLAVEVHAQAVVKNCTSVYGLLTIKESSVEVQAGGTLINQGTIRYDGVTSLSNSGWFFRNEQRCLQRALCFSL
jgi:hypothetical protein